MMKRIRVLLEGGTRKKLEEVEPGEKILGIILRRSKKVVSLNLYYILITKPTFSISKRFSFSKREDAVKDMNGKLNTESFIFSNPINITLSENEYIPSLGELLEATKSAREINLVRERIGLEPLYDSWYLSSTIKDDKIVYVSIGLYDFGCLSIDNKNRSYPLLTFLKDDSIL